MEQQKKPLSPEQMTYIWIGVGIALAIAFIVIGSVFFDLKPGPSESSNSASEPIDASQYAPSDY
jgi:hypothetical protein